MPVWVSAGRIVTVAGGFEAVGREDSGAVTVTRIATAVNVGAIAVAVNEAVGGIGVCVSVAVDGIGVNVNVGDAV